MKEIRSQFLLDLSRNYSEIFDKQYVDIIIYCKLTIVLSSEAKRDFGSNKN